MQDGHLQDIAFVEHRYIESARALLDEVQKPREERDAQRLKELRDQVALWAWFHADEETEAGD